MPGNEEDLKDMDNYLPYPELDDVYHLQPEQYSSNHQQGDNIGDTVKITGTTVSTETCILETNKDYPLQRVIKAVKSGGTPSLQLAAVAWRRQHHSIHPVTWLDILC